MVYHSIDLFAGIGGIRMGFEKAFGRKLDTVFVSEWDIPHSRHTVRTFTINSRLPAISRRSKKAKFLPSTSVWQDFPVRRSRWQESMAASRTIIKDAAVVPCSRMS